MANTRGSLLARLHPADGTGEFLLQTGFSLTKLASFTASAWHLTGQAPVYWRWDYDIRRGRYSLLLVVAPCVRLDRADILTLDLPNDLIPEVLVVRAAADDLVPEAGAPYRAQEIVGEPYWLINGYRQGEEESFDAGGGWQDYFVTFGIVPDMFKALVEPGPNGVTIRHGLNHWQVKVHVPWDDPAAFAFDVIMPKGFDPLGGMRNYLQGAGDFRIRVSATANVVVQSEILISGVGERLSRLVCENRTVEQGSVPPQGSDLSSGDGWRPVEPAERLSPATISAASAAEFAIGFIPVVGSVVGVAHALYLGATGKDIWGEKLTPGQIMLNGLLALLGAAGETRAVAQVLSRVAGRLFPGRSLVTLNPGLVTDLKEIVEESCNAYLLEAMRRFTTGDLDRALTTLDDVTAGIKPLSEVAGVLEEVIYRGAAEVASSGTLPERLVVDSLDWIHPGQFDDFPDLPVPQQRTIIDAYNSVVGGLQPVSHLISYLEPGLAVEFASRLDEWRAGRVMNVLFTGFRNTTLRAAFARYGESSKGHYTAIQWAVSQGRGAAATELTLTIGRDFRTLLRSLDPDELWKISDEALAHYLKNGNKINFYETLARLNRGFGILFEIDHGVEYRFFRNMPFLEEYMIAYDHVQAIMVPKNPMVANRLPKDAVNYPHSVKTAMLASLIPHGAEAAYGLQEVLDAYTLVYVHWLKAPLEVFVPLIHDVFADMAAKVPVRLDLRILTEEQLLSRNPSFRSWSTP